MSILLLAAMMMGQAPAAAQPAASPAPVAKKQKPQQVCEMMEITGSRGRERVCHDVGTAANLAQFGVSDSAFGKGSIRNADQTTAAAPK
jgi:hypothetical protein